MNKRKTFFIHSNELDKLKLIDNFCNILSRFNSQLPIKEYKHYISIIKRYRTLGFLNSKLIKVNIINETIDDFAK